MMAAVEEEIREKQEAEEEMLITPLLGESI